MAAEQQLGEMIELGLQGDHASRENAYCAANVLEAELKASDARFELDGFRKFRYGVAARWDRDSVTLRHGCQS